jgi:GNAT superfamily N-acetyltransferase
MPASQIRPLTPQDLELVVRHREEMFREMGPPEADLTTMTAAFQRWLEPRLRNETYFGWAIERGGIPVAGLGMFILDWPPHPAHPDDCRRACVLNVFVEPEHRGKGLATELIMKVARDEASRRGIAFMTLHASQQGRPVYEKLGWESTTEMSLAIGKLRGRDEMYFQ